MNLNGGYAMIKHDATQKDLEIAYKTKRPVLLYDADHRAHWAQINEKVIETVDEETQETLTTYEYSYQLLNAIEALVDDSGNPRFIEGDGIPATIDGFTATYCRWSLSGTHLMFVLAGAFANGTALTNNTVLANFTIPEDIYNKIFPTFSNVIEIKNIPCYNTEFTTQTLSVQERKRTSEKEILLQCSGALTLTDDRNFRMQFDLLIDTE